MSCLIDSFSDFIAKCEDTIKVNAQLEPETSYRWIITDKFGSKYQSAFITDANGNFEIPVESLPDRLLNEYAGNFKLEIQDSGCTPIKFKVAGMYESITFKVVPGDYVKDNLGCPFTCVGTVGASNLMLTYSNQELYEIDYTDYIDTYGNSPIVQVYHETATPGVYERVTVDIEHVRVNGVLQTINVYGGYGVNAYVLIAGQN